LRVEKVITGLEVPWEVAILPNQDWLITERPGRIRIVQSGQLVPQAVAEVMISETGEGGLLGLALHPGFETNRLFYVFYTTLKNGEDVNRVEQFILSPDHRTATPQKIILDDIPAASYHDGGRIKFGPDGMLYIATGDSRDPDLAQNQSSLNGKLLRLTPEGDIPQDNPQPNSLVFASGLRNLQAFDWVDPNTLMVADHGPTGDLGLTGLDEISFVNPGANLGWPIASGCQTSPGIVSPVLAWQDAAPPGGALIYKGSAIPEFNGNFLVTMLGTGNNSAMQLHRVVFDAASKSLISHEVYFQDEFGRLREIIQGPDGSLYVTTSNCDGRGICPSEGDSILKISRH
jgi:glucose/arabinose dehydrogenase